MSESTSRQVTAERVDGKQLAQLNEEMRARIQIQDIESSTVAPGKIMVPVKAVATAEDNDQINIRVEHPIDDEVSFYLDKPRTWDPENELVEFLNWYDLSINGIYQLQTHDICIERTDDRVKGWELCEPPGYTPDRTVRERVQERIPSLPTELHVIAFVAMSAVTIGSTTVGTVMGYTAETSGQLGGAIVGGFLVGCIGALIMLGVALVMEEFGDV